MRKTLLTISTVAALLPLSAHALQPVSDATLFTTSMASTAAINAVVVNFSELSLNGFTFNDLTATVGPFTGTLVSVSVNATLNSSVDYTYADDLTIYVDPAPLSLGGLLQVGGFSNLGAAERASWANGASDVPGTTVIDSYTLLTPLAFTGTGSDPTIWLGNGYGAAGTNGVFSGSVTLNFEVAAIPEPSTWALFALGGLGVAAWARRRRAR